MGFCGRDSPRAHETVYGMRYLSVHVPHLRDYCRRSLTNEATAGIRDVFAMQQRPQIWPVTNSRANSHEKITEKNEDLQRSKDSSLRMFAMSKVLPLERLEPGHRQLDLGRGALRKIWELDSLKRLETLIDMR